MKKSTYKVPGGKLLKISLEENNGVIQRIQIMGDFFLHPEESIVELEEILVGAELNQNKLSETIQSFLDNPDIILIGASSADIAKAIILADN